MHKERRRFDFTLRFFPCKETHEDILMCITNVFFYQLKILKKPIRCRRQHTISMSQQSGSSFPRGLGVGVRGCGLCWGNVFVVLGWGWWALFGLFAGRLLFYTTCVSSGPGVLRGLPFQLPSFTPVCQKLSISLKLPA